MKSLIFISIILLLTSCNSVEKKQLPNGLFIETEFYPSFHSAIKLEIHKIKETGYLTFRVLEYGTKDKIVSFDSVQLTIDDFIQFFKTLGSVSLLKIPYDTLDIGLDGVTFDGRISQDGELNEFWGWSPTRKEKPIQYKFLDAIFELLNNKLPRQENYIEDVQNYFSYGLPVKVKSTKPYVARMYGGLSLGDEGDLQIFFDKVPIDKTAILDMSNFGRMGTMFHPYFKTFDSLHPKLIWVIPGERRYFFKISGVDTTKMVESLELALKKAND